MKKIIFLDRDGVINKDFGYVHKIKDFKFLPNIFEILKKLQNLGYEFIIITNQSGIARGYFTETDFKLVTDYMLNEFNKNGIKILDIFYCPYHPEGKINKYSKESKCRKPNTGMIEDALNKYRIDLKNSVLIGDKLSDIELGLKFDLKCILMNKNKKIMELVKNKFSSKLNKVFFTKNWNEELINFINN
jgi:D,D-heptose 1,7-bisphosphate phosphatase